MMTVDERLEFLLRSTESLHASCQELHAGMSDLKTAQIETGDLKAAQIETEKRFQKMADTHLELEVMVKKWGRFAMLIARIHDDDLTSIKKRLAVLDGEEGEDGDTATH